MPVSGVIVISDARRLVGGAMLALFTGAPAQER
jgi:hypothetical protein